MALCHLPPMEKRNQTQSPSFMNQRRQMIKKNTCRETCTHTHMHIHTHPFLPRLSEKTKILCEGLCLGGRKEKLYNVVLGRGTLPLENGPCSSVGFICHPYSLVRQKNIITRLYQQISTKPNNMTSHVVLCAFEP